MHIILKITFWFVKKFPKFGALLSLLSLLIPLTLTLLFGFKETILMWTIYTEIIIVSLSILFGSINFIFESIFYKRKRRIKKESNTKNKYQSFKFTMF